MVAIPGDDPRFKNRGHSISPGPADDARYAKSRSLSVDVLANIIVCKFYSVRTAKRDFSGHPRSLRAGGGRRYWNDPRIGARVRRIGACLISTDEPRRS